MNKKLVYRLIKTYSLLLVSFALVSFGLFFFLLYQQSNKIQVEQMTAQGDRIATNIIAERDHQDDSSMSGMHRRMNLSQSYQSYIDLMKETTVDDMWLVDASGNSLLNGNSMHHNTSQKAPMPRTMTLFLEEVLDEGRPLLGKQGSLQQYGIPLVDKDGAIYGAVLMVSSVRNKMQQQRSDYVVLFISFLVTLVLTILLAIFLARRFVKPIYQMEDFTMSLINKTYDNELVVGTEDEFSHLSEKLLVLQKRLKIAQYEQENKDASQQLFLSQISHELRTPVMIIRNSLETLNHDWEKGNDNAPLVSQMMLEVKQLERLVNDLLELNRLQSTEFSLKQESVDLSLVISDAIRSYRGIFQKKGQDVVWNNKLEGERLIQGDYLRLIQLVKILLDNAEKYSVETDAVEIKLEEEHDTLSFSVYNKIPVATALEGDNDTLFKAFHRGKGTNREGHGLGLAISEQIVKRHHGTIHIEQLEDNDFVVRVSFPLT